MKRFVIILYLLFYFGLTVFSQGWEYSYPDNCGLSNCESYIVEVVPALDGGYTALETVNRHIDSTIQVMSVLKVDINGNLQWRKTYPHPDSLLNGVSIQATPDNGYIIVGNQSIDGDPINRKTFLFKINAFGDSLWRHSFDGIFTDPDIEITSNGDYIVTTHTTSNAPGWSLFGSSIYKIAANGNIIWSKNGFNYHNGHSYFELAMLPNDTMISLAQNYNNSPGDDFALVKLDPNGDTIQTRTFTNLSAYFLHYEADIRTVVEDNNTFYVITSHILNDTYIYKFDGNLNLIWQKAFPWTVDKVMEDIDFTADGHLMFTGANFNPNGVPNTVRAEVYKMDTSGQIIWSKPLPDPFSLQSRANSICYDNQGFNVIGGQFQNNSTLWKMDANGTIHGGLINGQVYFDVDNNCMQSAGETLLKQWIVEAVSPVDTHYAVTDTNGYYQMDVDTGNYIVSIYPPSSNWMLCQNNQSVSIISIPDTQTVDFAAQAAYVCPKLTVDISTPVLRQCCVNTYIVSYSNQGTQDASNAYVEVDLDNDLIYVNSSIPISTSTGNIYTFPVGNVTVNQTGQFTIDVLIDSTANIQLGQTHCSSAHIFPDSSCVPTPNWGGATVSVTGECLGDSIEFKIKNIGNADMAQSLQYFVIEDHVIMLQNSFQLNQGDSLIVPVNSQNGATYRLVAMQVSNHPYSNTPTAAIEGCTTGNHFTTGFLNSFSNDYGNNAVSLDCTQNVGSYDPNDKNATPEGWGTPNYILQNAPINYKIRFQNTGTDTAFNVVIRDTIDVDELDITTIQFGASSHNYQASILGQNIIKFTFNNIMLPDSNVNEPASHGFVEFSIQQKIDNPFGSLIENSAAIYFDNNAPIITNTVFHTVGQLPFVVKTDNTLPSAETIALTVYPNPFLQKATFELSDKTPRNLDFTVFDAMGRIVHQQHFNQVHQFEYYRNGLASGLYFFTVMKDGKVLGKGKVIVK